jgi:hypothetical protein
MTGGASKAVFRSCAANAGSLSKRALTFTKALPTGTFDLVNTFFERVRRDLFRNRRWQKLKTARKMLPACPGSAPERRRVAAEQAGGL